MINYFAGKAPLGQLSPLKQGRLRIIYILIYWFPELFYFIIFAGVNKSELITLYSR